MKKMYIVIAIIVLVAIVGFVAIRPAGSTMNMSGATKQVKAPTEANAIYIQGYNYSPNPLKIKKGTTVTWTNNDIAKHTVSVDSGMPAGGPSSALFGKDQTFTFTFNTVGVFSYHCEPHPYMHGQVEVTE